MKKALFILVSAFMAVTSSFAATADKVAATFNSDSDNASEIVKSMKQNGAKSLILDKASNLINKVSGHYSHRSHSSHRSHYSSR